MAKKIHILTILSALWITGIYAQDNSNARSVGMSFGSITTSFGVDAYGLNPANFDNHKLTLKKKQTNKNQGTITQPRLKESFEISILSIGGGYGSDNSFSFYKDYTQYLTVNFNDLVRFFTDVNSTVDFKLNVLPTEQSNVNFDFELKWLSLNYANPVAGAFNVSIADKVNFTSIVNSRDEFLNFQATSNPNGTYNMNNFRLEQNESSAWWYRKYSAGYAKRFDFKNGSGIKNIAFGISASLVHGYGNIVTSKLTFRGDSYGIQYINGGANHVDSVKGTSSYNIQSATTDFFRGFSDGTTSQFSLFPKPAGKGYSFDFGLTMQITDYFRVSGSVIDLGKIKWDYNTFVSNDNNSFAYYDFYITDLDPVYRQLVDDIKGINGRDSNIVYETNMPSKYRAGISYQPLDMLLVEFNWMRQNSILPNGSPRDLYSLGGEFSPVYFLPLRAGISADNNKEVNLSIGAGIRLLAFSFDVGIYGLNQLIIGKRFLAALSTKLVF